MHVIQSGNYIDLDEKPLSSIQYEILFIFKSTFYCEILEMPFICLYFHLRHFGTLASFWSQCSRMVQDHFGTKFQCQSFHCSAERQGQPCCSSSIKPDPSLVYKCCCWIYKFQRNLKTLKYDSHSRTGKPLFSKYYQLPPLEIYHWCITLSPSPTEAKLDGSNKFFDRKYLICRAYFICTSRLPVGVGYP